MRFQRLSEGVELAPAAVVQVEGRSTVEDWRPRNSYHRDLCYREQICAENYNKWHSPFLLKSQSALW